ALQLDAEHAAERVPVRHGVDAGHAEGAAVGDPQARHALHGGGLARAVRAEDAEDLAGLDLERHVIHRHVVLVALVEVPYLDDVHAVDARDAGSVAESCWLPGEGVLRCSVRTCRSDAHLRTWCGRSVTSWRCWGSSSSNS